MKCVAFCTLNIQQYAYRIASDGKKIFLLIICSGEGPWSDISISHHVHFRSPQRFATEKNTYSENRGWFSIWLTSVSFFARSSAAWVLIFIRVRRMTNTCRCTSVTISFEHALNTEGLSVRWKIASLRIGKIDRRVRHSLGRLLRASISQFERNHRTKTRQSHVSTEIRGTIKEVEIAVEGILSRSVPCRTC